jgi:hypothetical protein
MTNEIKKLIEKIKILGCVQEVEFSDIDFYRYIQMSNTEAFSRLLIIKNQLISL